jgi:hypothetical protein
MLVVAFTPGELWRLSLAMFLVAVGLSPAYVFVRPAGTVTRVSSFIRGAEESVLPVIGKVGGSVDRVNGQLDKVDRKEAAARRELGLADELRNAGT